MKQLFYLAALLSLCVHAAAEGKKDPVDSTYQGVRFEEALNWQEILTKAKIEHKYIFVDCYTTWCGPCKLMDREVYPKASVGEVFNSRFISVRAQMDTSAADNELVKKRYPDAHLILSRYKIDAFPTFLFFSPDGKLLNRSMGAHKEEAFRDLAKETTDPEKNYYTMLERFHQGNTDLAQTSWLARQSLVLGDTASSQKIATSYLARLKEQDLLTKPNIEFMREFTKTSADKGFSLFYTRADSVDAIVEDDQYAQGIVNGIIYREMVGSELEKARQSGTQPDWDRLSSSVQHKYNAYYAERLTMGARSSWAFEHKDWAGYTKYLVQYMEKFGSKTNRGDIASLILNNYAWEIFQYSQDPAELTTALGWSQRAVLMNPLANWMDTYANLLHKLGRKQESIMWEEIAAKLDPKNPDIIENLSKIKEGKPTWPLPASKQ